MFNKYRELGQASNYKISILIIFITYILGLIYGYYSFSPGNKIPSYLTGINPSFNFYFIILNNLLITFTIILSGFISFGLFPIILTFREAYQLSSILQQLAWREKASFLKLFCFGILPHGILEISAFILSSALGLFLGYKLLKNLPNITLQYSFYQLGKSLQVYHLKIAPLILLAGIIEVFLTPFFIINLL